MLDEVWDSFAVQFVLERGLAERLDDGLEYVTECRGKITCWRDTNGEGAEIPGGKITAYRIHAGQALEDGQNLAYECDAFDVATHEYCQAFYGADGGFRESVLDQFPDAFVAGADLLALHVIRVQPEFRGRGVGLRASRRAIDLLAGGCGIVAMKPFPQQFEGVGEGAANADEFYAGLSTDRPEAWRRLESYWTRIGFVRLGDSPYFALSPSNGRLNVGATSDA